MSCSPMRGKRPEDMLVALKTLTQWPETSRSSFLIFLHFIFSLQPTIPPVFNQTPKSKFNSPVLISLKSFVRRKLIPVFDPRPLYCSSLTTAVGGTKDTNFVDSGSPYCGTNQLTSQSTHMPTRHALDVNIRSLLRNPVFLHILLFDFI